MRMIVHLELEVKIERDRTNANEIFVAVGEASREAEGQVMQKVVEAYQEEVVLNSSRDCGLQSVTLDCQNRETRFGRDLSCFCSAPKGRGSPSPDVTMIFKWRHHA